MQDSYTHWQGKAVILHIVAADLNVPLKGVIVGESSEALRFRVGQNWDIDIYKSMVLSVEADACLIINESAAVDAR
jgi:hypothetical protein